MILALGMIRHNLDRLSPHLVVQNMALKRPHGFLRGLPSISNRLPYCNFFTAERPD